MIELKDWLGKWKNTLNEEYCEEKSSGSSGGICSMNIP